MKSSVAVNALVAFVSGDRAIMRDALSDCLQYVLSEQIGQHRNSTSAEVLMGRLAPLKGARVETARQILASAIADAKKLAKAGAESSAFDALVTKAASALTDALRPGKAEVPKAVAEAEQAKKKADRLKKALTLAEGEGWVPPSRVVELTTTWAEHPDTLALHRSLDEVSDERDGLVAALADLRRQLAATIAERDALNGQLTAALGQLDLLRQVQQTPARKRGQKEGAAMAA